MRKLVVAAMIGAGVMASAPARAMSDVTYLAAEGADSGGCDIFLPCVSLAYALQQTNPGGTMTVLDSGNYGSVIINKGLTLRADTPDTLVIASIEINAGVSDQVIVRGLTFNAIHAGLRYDYGIKVTQANQVLIDGCKFSNYGSSGTATGALYIEPVSFSRVTVFGTQMFNNATGVTVSLNANAAQGASSHLKIFRSFLSSNTDAGIRVIGSGNDAMIESTQIFGSTKSVDLQGGALARTYGNNVITNGDSMIPIPLN